MKIFNSLQIKKANAFTISQKGITELDLMENAAKKLCAYFTKNFSKKKEIYIFCGPGNNGGDGYALARLLILKGRIVKVFRDKISQNISSSAEINLENLYQLESHNIYDFAEIDDFKFNDNSIIVDSLFGSGINRSLENPYKDLILKLNKSEGSKIAIDCPSGLFIDKLTPPEFPVFNATLTLSLQFWKLSFLHLESAKYCGKIEILNIALSEDFIKNENTENFIIDKKSITEIYKPREDFSHKGTFGSAEIISGSYGKIGAAVLATQAALKSGSGLTFCVVPECGNIILQTTCPEAMFISAGDNYISKINVPKNAVIAMGPGIGTKKETQKAILEIITKSANPIIIDADALNILSKNKPYLKNIPPNSILTPHPKEFERLFGKTADSFERTILAKKKAKQLNVIIILKGHHTQIFLPDGSVFYNNTGNSGMAKGGSGDALTGILTAFLSQNYSPKDFAILGVWLHGKAGDFAAKKLSKEAMLPSDLINEIGNVFLKLQT